MLITFGCSWLCELRIMLKRLLMLSVPSHLLFSVSGYCWYIAGLFLIKINLSFCNQLLIMFLIISMSCVILTLTQNKCTASSICTARFLEFCNISSATEFQYINTSNSTSSITGFEYSWWEYVHFLKLVRMLKIFYLDTNLLFG